MDRFASSGAFYSDDSMNLDVDCIYCSDCKSVLFKCKYNTKVYQGGKKIVLVFNRHINP